MMLRSIFSLIHRILDSDKKYNNTKSEAVIYCFTNPDKTVNMDLVIDGKAQKSMKNLRYQENAPIDYKEKSFTIKTEQGDTVTCKHKLDVNIVPKGQKENYVKEESYKGRLTFSNTQDEKSEEEKAEKGTELDGEIRPNVKDLIEHFPKKRVDLSSKQKDQISSLLEQIQKMKTGLQRLHEIAIQFSSSERFAEDINFLVNNIRPYLRKNADKEDQHISPKV